ncbi:glycoside hydrolase [Flavilitoribacter nigricans]|uniref:Cellulose-binding protein n=1 Tax=Flavilitoribacter nigricans (strain ATCC 23147 / DSM 23189 / NBRC 102662 / NCIMB 1420 / SS-2) TaxID=1122177 RepID=A0A2D0MZE8_FLAN2|nr:cellulose-binding protein [Flavilitoribacter nigricans]PHN01625.1 cellulose-binding protein [Flavilitoribacter nigricans DSM 23189 = NBRC 102662]
MKIKISPLTPLLCCLSLWIMTSGCEKENTTPGMQEDPFTITIQTDQQYQTIAGFGGANRMWGTQFLKPAEAEKAFSVDGDGLGLSIFRVRIASNPAEWPLILESVQEATRYGVKIQASPWSPPAELKSNGSEIGGYLLPEHYGAFKDHINEFVQYMADNGVDIYAVSIQNEPDIQVSYESCDWSPAAMIDFISQYGHLIEGTRLAAPESFNFNSSFTNALLNDTEAVKNIDIVAGHIYGGGLAPLPLAESEDKEIWMTEYLLNLNTGNAGAAPWTSYDEAAKWAESLTMLNTVHEAMTHNWNAYIWWYLQRYYSFIGDGEQGTTEGEILKRGYAFSHFSKYVRPGSVRVGTQASEDTPLNITAYESDRQIVVVVVNPGAVAVGNVNFTMPSAASAKAYATSAILTVQERPVDVQSDRVITGILPESVTTIVIEK